MFCEKEKKSKCPKKNFQSVKKEKKKLSIEFRVFGKKNEGKVPRKKNEVFFGMKNWSEKFLLSSYSLVGLLVKGG